MPELHQARADEIRRSHGARKITLEFSGDGANLAGLPGVASLRVEGDTAHFTMTEDLPPDQLLRAALDRVRVTRFDAGEASLEEIFIKFAGPEMAGDRPAAAMAKTETVEASHAN